MKKKRYIAVFCIAVLVASLCSFPAAAYSNGSANIYNNVGTKLGYVDMWTNNATTGRILYAQTMGNTIYSYTAAQALLKGMTGFAARHIESDIASKENSQNSYVAELIIPNYLSPVDARCIGAINTYVVGLCRRYNDGTGDGICSQGASCLFPTTLINN